MRLIDADKLEPDRMTDKGLAISQSQIANAPTVCDIYAIRDEIEQAENRGILNMNYVLRIIDKHTKGAKR